LGLSSPDPAFSGICPKSTRAPRFFHASLFPLRGIAKVYTQKQKKSKKRKFMFEIIQAENDFESVIDSKETQQEAQQYVSALNEMKKNEDTQFFYKECNSLSTNDNNLF
jgi:hypothetical protein